MKKLILIASLVLFLSSCTGDNPSPQAIQKNTPTQTEQIEQINTGISTNVGEVFQVSTAQTKSSIDSNPVDRK